MNGATLKLVNTSTRPSSAPARNPNSRSTRHASRAEVNEKNLQFWYDYRAINGAYIYGGRKAPFGIVNFPFEFAKLRKMIAKRDRRIWDVAQGKPVTDKIDDSDSGPLPRIETNVPEERHITTPDEALKTFKLPEGYKIELFASEVEFPDLKKPVQMTFDAKGRLWVTTMPSYPMYQPGKPVNDKVLIFEDSNGDGKADKQIVFADGLHVPTGIELGDGGAYVSAQPNMLFLKDTDGDGKADKKDIILGGFDTADSHHAIHALTWDPGGALYFNEGVFHFSQVETPYGPQRIHDAGLFRFEPKTWKFDIFVTYPFANPWGHYVDKWGQNFVADASGGANYYGTPFSGQVDYPEKHGGMNTFFPTQWRPTCGCELVASKHFPDDTQGDYLLNNDIGFQGILRYRVAEDKSGFKGTPVEPLLTSSDKNFRPVDLEFGPDGALYVVDWFNPLVGHMQHSIRDPKRDVEHGRIWRITYPSRPLVKSGQDRRRFDRRTARPPEIVRGSDPLPCPPRASREEARGGARHAQDLGRWPEQNRPRLLAIAARSPLAQAEPGCGGRGLPQRHAHLRRAEGPRRGHASPLLLAGPGQRTPRPPASPDQRQGAKGPARSDPRLKFLHRRRRYEGPGNRPGGAGPSPGLLPRIHPERDEQDARTQDQEQVSWSVAVGPVEGPVHPPKPGGLGLRRSCQFTSTGVLPMFRNIAPLMLLTLLLPPVTADDAPRADSPLIRLLKSGRIPEERQPQIIAKIGQLGSAEDLAFLFDRAADPKGFSPSIRAKALDSLAVSALTRKGLKPTGDLGRIGTLLASETDPASRLAAIRLAGLWKVEAASGGLRQILDETSSDDVARIAAIEALLELRKWDDIKLYTSPEKPRSVRFAAIGALSRKEPETAAKLAITVVREAKPGEDLAALIGPILDLKEGASFLSREVESQGLIADSAKLALRAVYALGRADAALIASLSKAAGVENDTKPPTKEEMDRLVAAVTARGDAARGERIFRRSDLNCNKCHSIAGAAGGVGPDLAAVGLTAPVDFVISSILTPDQAIKEQYHTLIVATNDGQIFQGIVADKDESKVVLKQATGELKTVPTSEIDESKEGGSLMPKGLANLLTRDEFVDLVKFVAELGKPGPYAIRSKPTIFRWRLMKPVPEELRNGSLDEGQFIAKVRDSEPSNWVAAYSLATGELPLDEFTELAGSRVLFLRGEIDVSSAGELDVDLGTHHGVSAWLDDAPGERPGRGLKWKVTPGRHTITLRIDMTDKKMTPPRVEISKAAGSSAEFSVSRRPK